MFTKKVLMSALCAAGFIGAVAAPLPGLAQVEIQLNFGPPPVRYEVVPEPRPGYVWSGGHWRWEGSRNEHVWVAGDYVAARPGYVYVQPQWVERDARWTYRAPRWDRDGDGVPNRSDARPDNPNRQ
ncbi:MAG TPA: hypothetical protein VFC14_09410 [Burkholderiales bacterium]|jgi:hypothetical protein|nr:hypothetical protein [Burkholderiales bacterium]